MEKDKKKKKKRNKTLVKMGTEGQSDKGIEKIVK